MSVRRSSSSRKTSSGKLSRSSIKRKVVSNSIINRKTLVYTHGGDSYKGSLNDRSLQEWKDYGKDHDMKYLYKGWRTFNRKTEPVVVFVNEIWSTDEIKRRNKNGFKGIRRYKL